MASESDFVRVARNYIFRGFYDWLYLGATVLHLILAKDERLGATVPKDDLLSFNHLSRMIEEAYTH